jgi:predicted nuclease with TOPRIM domain
MKSSWEQVQLNEDRLLKEQIKNEMQELQQENTQLKSELQALRERLQKLEWAASSFDPGFCPACCNYKVDGHLDDCWLKAELDKIGGSE